MKSPNNKICKKCKIPRCAKKGFGRYKLSTGSIYIDKTCRFCRNKVRRATKATGRTKKSGMYVCIHDPSGTYYRGHFNEGEVRKTAKQGYWPPGIIFLDQKTGTRYQVEGNDVYYYMQSDIMNDPLPEVKKEKQELVAI